jgi:hypothetical protein
LIIPYSLQVILAEPECGCRLYPFGEIARSAEELWKRPVAMARFAKEVRGEAVGMTEMTEQV